MLDKNKLLKTIEVAIIIGLCLGVASAVTYNITAGESTSFIIPEEYEYYSVVGNSTEVDLDVSQAGLNVTITIGKYTQNDSFEVIFFNQEKEVIHHYSYCGGGGTRTIYKDRNITEYVYRNITKYIERDEPNVEEEIIEEDGRVSILWYAFGFIVLVGIIVLIINRRQNKKKEGDENAEQR